MSQNDRITTLLAWVATRSNEEKALIYDGIHAIMDLVHDALQPTPQDEGTDSDSPAQRTHISNPSSFITEVSSSVERTHISNPSSFITDESSSVEEAFPVFPPSVFSDLALLADRPGEHTILTHLSIHSQFSSLSLPSALSIHEDNLTVDEQHSLALKRLEGRVDYEEPSAEMVEQWILRPGLCHRDFVASKKPPSPRVRPSAPRQSPRSALRRAKGVANLRRAIEEQAQEESHGASTSEEDDDPELKFPAPVLDPLAETDSQTSAHQATPISSPSPEELAQWSEFSEDVVAADSAIDRPVVRGKKWISRFSVTTSRSKKESPETTGHMRKFLGRIFGRSR